MLISQLLRNHLHSSYSNTMDNITLSGDEYPKVKGHNITIDFSDEDISKSFTMRPIKRQIQDCIVDAVKQSAYADPKRITVFTTLCDDNLYQEQHINRILPNVLTISVNKDVEKINSLRKNTHKAFFKNCYQNKTIPNMYLYKGNIISKSVFDLPYKLTGRKGINKVYWFDYCSTVNVYNDTFGYIDTLHKCGHNTIFLTFSLMTRVISNTDKYKKLFGYDANDTLEEGSDKMLLDINTKMTKMGYELIETFVYTVNGGKMITVGYRNPFTKKQKEQQAFNHTIDFQKNLFNVGYSSIGVANQFAKYGNIKAVGGLSKAKTMRNA